MYFDVGIDETFESLDSSDYHGFCLTRRTDSNSLSVPSFSFVGCSKVVYKKLEVEVLAEDFKNIHLNQLTDHEILSVKIKEENSFKYACEGWDVDIIFLDISKINFFIKDGLVRLAIKRGIFFEICIRDGIYESKERINWLRNVISLLKITKGKNIVFSSGARHKTEIKKVQDICKFLRFLGLSKKVTEMVVKMNPYRLLGSCANKRYTVKGCIANDIEEGNLKRDFILKDFF